MKLSIEAVAGGFLVEASGTRSVVVRELDLLPFIEEALPHAVEAAYTRYATQHWFRITLQRLAQPFLAKSLTEACCEAYATAIHESTGILPTSVTCSAGAISGPVFGVSVREADGRTRHWSIPVMPEPSEYPTHSF